MQDLKAFVSNALQQADKNGFCSIAFPAIGTGILHYPCDVVAKIMAEEIMAFSRQNPKTSLRDVRIVLLPSDTSTIKVKFAVSGFNNTDIFDVMHSCYILRIQQ